MTQFLASRPTPPRSRADQGVSTGGIYRASCPREISCGTANGLGLRPPKRRATPGVRHACWHNLLWARQFLSRDRTVFGDMQSGR